MSVLIYIARKITSFPFAILAYFLIIAHRAIQSSANAYAMKMFIDMAPKSDGTIMFFIKPIVIYMSVSIFGIVAYRAYDYFVGFDMNPKLRKMIAEESVSTLIGKSYGYHLNNLPGNLKSRVTDLIGGVPDIINDILFWIMPTIFALITVNIAAYNLSTKFGLLISGWILCYSLVMGFFNPVVLRLSGNAHNIMSINGGKMVDIFSNIFSVKLFNGNQNENKYVGQIVTEFFNADRKSSLYFMFLWGLIAVSSSILHISNIILLMKDVSTGKLTIGAFSLMVALLAEVGYPIFSLAYRIGTCTTLFGKITQALSVIEEKSSVNDDKNASKLIVSEGGIEFNNVSFSYNQNKLFDNLSIKIKSGEKVGLVGYSGGGKTSFVNLILRLYDIDSGSITIDNQNIAHVTQKSLRDNISVIPQDPSMFHRSILDNIKYAKPNATKEEITEAARKASADEFIEKLPQKYETEIGDKGFRLSGGQRQRIAIARAILRDAPIFILDEATSQMDAITEENIQNDIIKVLKGKTVIVIAHRLSTLNIMDRILVFDKGNIVQNGPHQELLKDETGLYYKLWTTQSHGFMSFE